MSFLKRFIEKSLSENVPRKIKRIIFITTLVGEIEGIKEPDNALLDKINTFFKLNTDSDSLKFPFLFKKAIWNDVEVKEKRIQDHPDIIVKTMPSWLTYGSKELMLDDISRVFELKDQLHHIT